jgi:hypothetical protein
VLAFVSAAVTLFWLLGGTLGLDELGGEVERLARERSVPALAVGVVALIAKLSAGVLALVLANTRRVRGPRRPAIALGFVGGSGLALYGGVLVVAGALVLSGVLDPSGPRDEYALGWHVFFWDLWFVAWGLALALAALRARRRERHTAELRHERAHADAVTDLPVSAP